MLGTNSATTVTNRLAGLDLASIITEIQASEETLTPVEVAVTIINDYYLPKSVGMQFETTEYTIKKQLGRKGKLLTDAAFTSLTNRLLSERRLIIGLHISSHKIKGNPWMFSDIGVNFLRQELNKVESGQES